MFIVAVHLVFLGETSIALDALLLLQQAAADDADWEAEDRHCNRCCGIIVLDPTSAVGAVVPAELSVFR